METAIEVSGLCKAYKTFALDGVAFTLPKGEVLGFIGPNGAGKTTTIRIMLGLARADSGTVSLLGGHPSDPHVRERIGFVHDGTFLNEDLTAKETGRIVGPLYRSWNMEEYRSRLARYGLDEGQKIAEFSKGMKIKLMLAIATSHNAELILMDEPTSGLDPVFRSEFLDELFAFMQAENRSIFFSTHITEDLNRIADRVVLLDKGRVVFEKTKIEIEDDYRIVKGPAAALSSHSLESFFAGPASPRFVGLRRDEHSFTALCAFGAPSGARSERGAAGSDFPPVNDTGIVTERASLDDIMIFTTREDYRANARL